MVPDHEGEREEEEELADLVARHEVRQLLRLDPELPLHRSQRRRQVSVAHAFNVGFRLQIPCSCYSYKAFGILVLGLPYVTSAQ